MPRTIKATPVRGPRKAGSEATRQKILDAAEILFAERGFHSVSVRDITTEAGVDVALINYHFGSKQLLFVVQLCSERQPKPMPRVLN